MKMCQKHWDHLRDRLKQADMFHLVPESGENAVSRIKSQIEGQVVVPDPLMEAHNMILSRALEYLGLYIMGSKEEGEEMIHYCPLCEAREHLPPHPETGLPCDESWISTLVDYLKGEYIKEGWLNVN